MSGPASKKTVGGGSTGGRQTGDPGTGGKLTGDRGNRRPGTEEKGTRDRGRAPAPPTPRYLVAPDEVVFPDAIVGDVLKMPVWLFNVHPSSVVNLHVEVEVARDRPSDVPPFQIVSAPSRLRPSREGAGDPVVIAFQSQRRADYAGKLVAIASGAFQPIEPLRVEIRLRGWTRKEGEPLRADVAAAEAARKAADREARAKAEREATMQRRYEQESDAPYPQSKVNELERQANLAKIQLEKLSDRQFAAMTVVQEETKKFQRRSPPTGGFGMGLAMFAVEVATAGIAARVAAGVVKAFSNRVKYVPPAPAQIPWDLPKGTRYTWVPTEGPPRAVPIPAIVSPEGMAALNEMVKATIKGTLQAPMRELQADTTSDDRRPVRHDGRGSQDSVSGVAELQFFYLQAEGIADETSKRKTALVNLHALLKPSLRREADAAITAMGALRESLTGEVPNAALIQANQTRQAWMSFLSQQSVGSLNPAELRGRGLRMINDTVTVTDAAQLARPTSGGKAPPYDGVLDVYFRANRHRPLDPLKIERVHMSGVIKEMLDACLAHAGLAAGRQVSRFGDLRLALRAIAIASGFEDFGVVVTRDEAGNVFSSDTTGALAQDNNWLARRSGHDRTSPAMQQEGAVHLMNEILRSEFIRRITVSTDAA
ncbi:MAG: hypothetical protein F9K40_04610 [Kofleriaceae bacterium]|nr:MAG: hypothetical protein F9K40_04610 [Kofleriaceae bacterium]MBZ0232888.1 hypothetical protein [Kofleriaceae bacterium]